MSWLSKVTGVNISLKKYIPEFFVKEFETKAWRQLLSRLSDSDLKGLSIALDVEWQERRKKVVDG